MNKITVEYTGEFPNLCFGDWIIRIGEERIILPSNEHFNTKGTYSTWHFDEDYSEVFEDYEDGEAFEAWVTDIPNGLQGALELQGFKVTESLLRELYVKIQPVDFRTSSCGGCI